MPLIARSIHTRIQILYARVIGGRSMDVAGRMAGAA
jgi:hypothetical protein